MLMVLRGKSSISQACCFGRLPIWPEISKPSQTFVSVCRYPFTLQRTATSSMNCGIGNLWKVTTSWQESCSVFSLGTLEKGSGPETFSGLGLVGLDRGDICHIIPNLQHCTVLLTIGIGGTLATSHQIVLYHTTTRHGDKMYQYHVLGLVVLDREEVLVRKRARFYCRARPRGHFDPGCQVYSSQSCSFVLLDVQ